MPAPRKARWQRQGVIGNILGRLVSLIPDRLALAQGLDAGRVLTASFVNAINTADSEKALETIRAKVEEVRSVLGDKIADGLLDQAKEKAEALADALDKATPGINSVREAMAAYVQAVKSGQFPDDTQHAW